jgi:predicted dehydrogenase
VRTLAVQPGAELRWCCDKSEIVLRSVRQQFPQLRTTSNPHDLLEDPQLHGVIIATPAPTHYALGVNALKAGKHTLIEKPMTLRTCDALDLCALAEKHRRVLMVGHLLEHHPAIRHIMHFLDQEELGELYYIYSQRLNLGTLRNDENAWWSLAPHDVSVACRLLGGAPLTVQCRGQNVVQPKIADVVFATLEFPKCRIAHIHVSWLDPHKTRKLTAVGSKKMIELDDTLPAYKLTVYDKGFHINQNFKSFADWISMRQGDILIPKHDTSEPLVLEAQHFIDCIVSGQRPLSDGVAGALVASILEHGQLSLDRGGELVHIPPLDLKKLAAA